MTDPPVTVVIEHPSCTGCKHAPGPDYSHCHGCVGYSGPLEHGNFEPVRRRASGKLSRRRGG